MHSSLSQLHNIFTSVYYFLHLQYKLFILKDFHLPVFEKPSFCFFSAGVIGTKQYCFLHLTCHKTMYLFFSLFLWSQSCILCIRLPESSLELFSRMAFFKLTAQVKIYYFISACWMVTNTVSYLALGINWFSSPLCSVFLLYCLY